jgi:poly-gamma-glutamate synthesis protein (capsule biosynthesis protein)
MVEGLTFAGINIVNIANNHTRNFGSQGFTETKNYLDQAGIKWVDGSSLAIIEKGGVKFGFLGFDYVFGKPSDTDLEQIRNADSKVDVLIVGVHWGQEYTSIPTNDQRLIAKDLVAAGAGVVAGHHPHWVQANENIEGKPVYYSLGNFVFDQMWSEETKKGLAIELFFKDGNIVKEDRLPVYMSAWAQPEWLNP